MSWNSTLKPSSKPKLRLCKGCRERKEPYRFGAVCCSPECAEKYALEKSEKEARKQAKAVRAQDKVRKEKLKTKADYIKEAQIAFNAYVRKRDMDKPCICCGRTLETGSVGGGFDCGHYRSVGSAPHLRFDERNAHGQTKQCNRYGAGRAVDYRIGLIARIGLEAVEALEADNTPRHYTIDKLKAIKAEFRAKLKMLDAGK